MEFCWRKIRLMVGFVIWSLSKYYVGTCYKDKQISNESAMSKIVSLWIDWKRYKLFQIISLTLKSLVIIRTFWIFTSVFLRYFKAGCLSSE